MAILHPKRAAVLAACLARAAAAAVDDDFFGNSISSTSQLPYDENGKLSSHVLIYPAGNCAEYVRNHFGGRPNPFGFEFFAVEGEASDKFFSEAELPDPESEQQQPEDIDGCHLACQEIGADRSISHAIMPQRHYDGSQDSDYPDDFERFFAERCQKTEVGFMNYHSRTHPIRLYWISPEGEERPHGEIKYAERNTKCFESYLGHTFRFRDGETNEILADHVVEFVTMRGIGAGVGPYDTQGRDFDDEIRRTHSQEWNRHDRVTRTFSSLGFRKGRLPDDVFSSMGAFYYNNRNFREKEEWTGKGVFINWWEVDVYFVQIPWGLKGRWQARLMELVEAWTGVELEQTDMYGLRRYEEGARLLTHVDRESTHAASLIVNIAQGNLSKPWPVEVYDHGNRLHEVPMTPGDVVYYESARCLHGRNRPLEGPGAYYVNLFTHYRPVGDPRWFARPNPEGTPEPLVDVGECRLVGNGEEFGNGAVECDDPAVGPNLSPTLFSGRGGDSLQTWWEEVSPEEKKKKITPAVSGGGGGGGDDDEL
uniref:von Hippel-Lindau disease tumour suppressor beta domain-containing protein n=1 Tax=Odontella aurita TaxID=265563 RepID=A0A7S4MHH3_9STRA